ncbi:MAG: glycosyltransferase, partial [Planctomycetota bacterium]
DVAVLCSRTEGLSNALLEYMAAARPIVATSVGGNCELIEDNQNGLLVAPGSVDELAAAIGRLLADRPLAARLGGAARRKAIEQYNADVQARRCEVLYERLLAIRGRQPALTQHPNRQPT